LVKLALGSVSSATVVVETEEPGPENHSESDKVLDLDTVVVENLPDKSATTGDNVVVGAHAGTAATRLTFC
jgi:hypothetical protein